MDGRIYDPVIGRFLSADPFVQDPANSQSLNRYSYCINNPLAFTDPTGFSCWRNIGRWIKHNPIVRIAIGVVVGVALGILLGPAGFAIQYAWTIGGAAAGIVTGGLALASGVGLKQALGEGLLAASIVGSLGPALDRIFNKPPKSANPSGNPTPTQPESGDSGAEKPKTPGEDFTDKSSYNSAQNGTPPDGKYFQDSVPGYTSNRASAGSNQSNGAGSAAYWELFEGRIHDAASDLAKEKKSYKDMKCNEAVERIFHDSGFEYYKYDNTKSFPSHSNAKHFDLLTVDQVSAGKRTGDVALWYDKSPKTGELVHHMMIYDPNASVGKNGEQNNAWTTHTKTHNHLFDADSYQKFSRAFGFEPKWYRYHE